MKNLKRRIVVIFAAAMLCFGLSVAPLSAKAETETIVESSDIVSKNEVSTDDIIAGEETPVEEENASNSSNLELETDDGWGMDPELEKYLQPLICAAGGLSGTAMVLLWFALLFKKGLKAFKEIRSWWKDKKEELANDGIDLAKIRNEIVNAITSNEEVKAQLEELSRQNKEEYNAFLSAVNTAIDSATKLVSAAEEACEKRVEICEKAYQQIKEILILIATGNSELIRRGIADEIVRKFMEEKLEVSEENVG